MKLVRLLPTILVKYSLKLVYYCLCLVVKIDQQKVTFASYRSSGLKDNLEYISRYLETVYPNYKQTFLFKKYNGKLTGKLSYYFHMIEAAYKLATSRYFIIDDYYLPIYFLKPRKGVEVIQLWHSSGALKKFGLSLVGKRFGPSREYLKHVKVHGNYSKVYVSSEEVVPFYAEAFGMEKSNIYPLGVPRTDYFFDKEKVNTLREVFIAEYPEFIDKKIILYAPTFRGKSHEQSEYVLPFNIKKMEEELKGEYILLVHLHPYMRGNLKLDGDFAFHMKNNYSIQELLALSDVLITDYSAIFFDYCLLERPIIFFSYDIVGYKEERDFYYDYEKLVPGPIVGNTEDLIAVLKKSDFDINRIVEFKKRFFMYQDGKATERITNHIFNKDDGLPG